MLNELGIETGVDLDKLLDAAQLICRALGRETNSKFGRAPAAEKMK